MFFKKTRRLHATGKICKLLFFSLFKLSSSSKLFSPPFLKRVLFHFILHIIPLPFSIKTQSFQAFGRRRIFFGVGDLCIYGVPIYKQTISFIGPTQLLFFGYLTFSQLCFHFFVVVVGIVVAFVGIYFKHTGLHF